MDNESPFVEALTAHGNGWGLMYMVRTGRDDPWFRYVNDDLEPVPCVCGAFFRTEAEAEALLDRFRAQQRKAT